MKGAVMLDLENLLSPEPCFDAWDVRRYWEWEEKVAEPALKAAGYTVLRWYSTEKDSFGPLGRAAVCHDSDGNEVRFYYG